VIRTGLFGFGHIKLLAAVQWLLQLLRSATQAIAALLAICIRSAPVPPPAEQLGAVLDAKRFAISTPERRFRVSKPRAYRDDTGST